MNSVRDQSGSPYGETTTPRSPFSPFSPLSIGDERHRNLADSKRDTATTPRSPFSPFSPLSVDKSLAESKFQQALASSGALGTQNSLCLNSIPNMCNICISVSLCNLVFCFTADPLSPGSHHGGHKFHEVFQMKQGRYDLQASKISEMMKSSSLDVSPLPFLMNFPWTYLFLKRRLYNVLGLCLMQNAPTQSLLSVVNGILDESIERKNGEIPPVIF